MNCETCKFFSPNARFSKYDLDDLGYTDHGSCYRIVHGNGQRDPSYDTAPALVVDGSGYQAKLIVLPTFGCNLYEAK